MSQNHDLHLEEVSGTPPRRLGPSVRATSGELAALANTFGLLASTTRLRIVEALAGGELCVGELAEAVGVGESAVSHQLRRLRERRLVRFRKAGRMIYYRLDDDHVAELLRTGLDHLRESEE